MQGVFSLKGFTRWLENPTSKQSSCSCSLMYLMMSLTAIETGILFTAASLRSCSVTKRCCCRFETTMSINAVSDRPMVNNLPDNDRKGNWARLVNRYQMYNSFCYFGTWLQCREISTLKFRKLEIKGLKINQLNIYLHSLLLTRKSVNCQTNYQFRKKTGDSTSSFTITNGLLPSNEYLTTHKNENR